MYFRQLKKTSLLCIFLFVLVGIIVSAQESGIIRGKITDAEYGGGLPGVNVLLKGTILAVATGHDGRFIFTDVQEGTYALRISLIGYKSVEQTVTVKSGEPVMLNISLEPGPVDLAEIRVEAERPVSAASSRAIRQFDLRVRPNRSAQDMLQLAPGLIIAQHAGGGKAEQIFIRGFDCDHGTDIAVLTDGIPVNMVTHAHGQGYADLHFLIPEVVDSIDVFKGPYFARFGNLATAGAVTYRTVDHVEQNLFRFEAGTFNTAKVTTLFQIPSGDGHQNAYFAGQFYATDGPFESPQNFKRFNLFGKFHTHFSETSRLTFTLGAFSSAWNASGQIPNRVIEAGTINRFGAIDDLEGGTTSRQNFALAFITGEGSANEFLIQGYASRYNFKLFSNFTFFLNDPVYGDMIEQTDLRSIAGFNSIYKFRRILGSTLFITTIGGGVRADNIALALWKSPDRIRQYPYSDANVYERNFFLWAEEELIFSPKWRLQLGLRFDYFTFNVDDKLDTEDNTESDLPHASGYHQEAILNPKLNLIFHPTESTDIYVNLGSGFHSNDARNVVYAQRIEELIKSLERRGLSEEEIKAVLEENNFDPDHRGIKTLPRAIGAELGLRTHITRWFVIGLAAWGIYLEEELVFVGDEGTTEISGETRRLGIDIEARFQLSSWLWADFDVNFADGKYINEPEGANHIPLAPRWTSTGGLTFIHPSGFEGTLRYRYLSDRPANEFNSVKALGHTLANIVIGYRFGRVKIFASLENLFNSDWNDAQFDTESRLYYEKTPISELHFTPGNPRNIQFGLSYQF